MRSTFAWIHISAAICAVTFGVSLEASPAEERQQITQTKSCLDAVQGTLERLEYLSRTWLSGSDNSHNIVRNFEVVKSANEQYFLQINSMADAPENNAGSVEELQRRLEDLDRSNREILGKLQQLNKMDDLLLASLPPVDSALEQVTGELSGATKVCSGDDLKMTDGLQEAVKGIRLQLATMRAYLPEAGAKRTKLYASVLAGKRSGAVTALASKLQRPLKELDQELVGLLAVSSLTDRIKIWWSGFTRGGIANGITTRDLQFSEGLRVLAKASGDLAVFRAELSESSKIPETARRAIVQDLDLYEKLINSERERVTLIGAIGFFERQKAMHEYRLQNLHLFVEGCRDAVKEYSSQVSTTADDATLAFSAAASRQEVTACVRL